LSFSPKPIERLLLGLLAAAALLAGSCQRRPEPAPTEGETLGGRWFQLVGGTFDPVEGPRALQSVEAGPWTVQARVSDLAALDGTLYLAVNGYGVAALDLPRSGQEQPGFRYFYDPTLFRYRTLTSLVPAGGSLLCHLYYNALLNVAEADRLPVRDLCLLRLYPAEGIYQAVPVPFLITHPGWECVGFAPQTPEQVLLEWKYSGLNETRFQYTRLSLPDLGERPIERREFRQASTPVPADRRLPQPLQEVFREAGRLEGGAGAAALYFVVRSAGEPLPRRYARIPPGNDRLAQERLLTLSGFQDGERLDLLTPEGLLLSAAGGGPARLRRLPALPAGFAYTGLYAFQGLLVASWEQSDFIRTGASGVLISSQP
jgi:hypothetical protein